MSEPYVDPLKQGSAKRIEHKKNTNSRIGVYGYLDAKDVFSKDSKLELSDLTRFLVEHRPELIKGSEPLDKSGTDLSKEFARSTTEVQANYRELDHFNSNQLKELLGAFTKLYYQEVQSCPANLLRKKAIQALVIKTIEKVIEEAKYTGAKLSETVNVIDEIVNNLEPEDKQGIKEEYKLLKGFSDYVDPNGRMIQDIMFKLVYTGSDSKLVPKDVDKFSDFLATMLRLRKLCYSKMGIGSSNLEAYREDVLKANKSKLKRELDILDRDPSDQERKEAIRKIREENFGFKIAREPDTKDPPEIAAKRKLFRDELSRVLQENEKEGPQKQAENLRELIKQDDYTSIGKKQIFRDIELVIPGLDINLEQITDKELEKVKYDDIKPKIIKQLTINKPDTIEEAAAKKELKIKLDEALDLSVPTEQAKKIIEILSEYESTYKSLNKVKFIHEIESAVPDFIFQDGDIKKFDSTDFLKILTKQLKSNQSQLESYIKDTKLKLKSNLEKVRVYLHLFNPQAVDKYIQSEKLFTHEGETGVGSGEHAELDAKRKQYESSLATEKGSLEKETAALKQLQEEQQKTSQELNAKLQQLQSKLDKGEALIDISENLIPKRHTLLKLQDGKISASQLEEYVQSREKYQEVFLLCTKLYDDVMTSYEKVINELSRKEGLEYKKAFAKEKQQLWRKNKNDVVQNLQKNAQQIFNTKGKQLHPRFGYIFDSVRDQLVEFLGGMTEIEETRIFYYKEHKADTLRGIKKDLEESKKFEETTLTGYKKLLRQSNEHSQQDIAAVQQELADLTKNISAQITTKQQEIESIEENISLIQEKIKTIHAQTQQASQKDKQVTKELEKLQEESEAYAKKIGEFSSFLSDQEFEKYIKLVSDAIKDSSDLKQRKQKVILLKASQSNDQSWTQIYDVMIDLEKGQCILVLPGKRGTDTEALLKGKGNFGDIALGFDLLTNKCYAVKKENTAFRVTEGAVSKLGIAGGCANDSQDEVERLQEWIVTEEAGLARSRFRGELAGTQKEILDEMLKYVVHSKEYVAKALQPSLIPDPRQEFKDPKFEEIWTVLELLKGKDWKDQILELNADFVREASASSSGTVEKALVSAESKSQEEKAFLNGGSEFYKCLHTTNFSEQAKQEVLKQNVKKRFEMAMVFLLGLSELHNDRGDPNKKCIFHGDIKPKNFMDGRAFDFGTSWLASQLGTDDNGTMDSQKTGTTEFMPPEYIFKEVSYKHDTKAAKDQQYTPTQIDRDDYNVKVTREGDIYQAGVSLFGYTDLETYKRAFNLHNPGKKFPYEEPYDPALIEEIDHRKYIRIYDYSKAEASGLELLEALKAVQHVDDRFNKLYERLLNVREGMCHYDPAKRYKSMSEALLELTTISNLYLELLPGIQVDSNIATKLQEAMQVQTSAERLNHLDAELPDSKINLLSAMVTQYKPHQWLDIAKAMGGCELYLSTEDSFSDPLENSNTPTIVVNKQTKQIDRIIVKAQDGKVHSLRFKELEQRKDFLTIKHLLEKFVIDHSAAGKGFLYGADPILNWLRLAGHTSVIDFFETDKIRVLGLTKKYQKDPENRPLLLAARSAEQIDMFKALFRPLSVDSVIEFLTKENNNINRDLIHLAAQNNNFKVIEEVFAKLNKRLTELDNKLEELNKKLKEEAEIKISVEEQGQIKAEKEECIAEKKRIAKIKAELILERPSNLSGLIEDQGDNLLAWAANYKDLQRLEFFAQELKSSFAVLELSENLDQGLQFNSSSAISSSSEDPKDHSESIFHLVAQNKSIDQLIVLCNVFYNQDSEDKPWKKLLDLPLEVFIRLGQNDWKCKAGEEDGDTPLGLLFKEQKFVKTVFAKLMGAQGAQEAQEQSDREVAAKVEKLKQLLITRNNHGQKSPIQIGFAVNDDVIIEEIVRTADFPLFDLTDQDGKNVLHYLVGKCNIDLLNRIRYLLKADQNNQNEKKLAFLNALITPDSNKQTPLGLLISRSGENFTQKDQDLFHNLYDFLAANKVLLKITTSQSLTSDMLRFTPTVLFDAVINNKYQIIKTIIRTIEANQEAITKLMEALQHKPAIGVQDQKRNFFHYLFDIDKEQKHLDDSLDIFKSIKKQILKENLGIEQNKQHVEALVAMFGELDQKGHTPLSIAIKSQKLRKEVVEFLTNQQFQGFSSKHLKEMLLTKHENEKTFLSHLIKSDKPEYIEEVLFPILKVLNQEDHTLIVDMMRQLPLEDSSSIKDKLTKYIDAVLEAPLVELRGKVAVELTAVQEQKKLTRLKEEQAKKEIEQKKWQEEIVPNFLQQEQKARQLLVDEWLTGIQDAYKTILSTVVDSQVKKVLSDLGKEKNFSDAIKKLKEIINREGVAENPEYVKLLEIIHQLEILEYEQQEQQERVKLMVRWQQELQPQELDVLNGLKSANQIPDAISNLEMILAQAGGGDRPENTRLFGFIELLKQFSSDPNFDPQQIDLSVIIELWKDQIKLGELQEKFIEILRKLKSNGYEGIPAAILELGDILEKAELTGAKLDSLTNSRLRELIEQLKNFHIKRQLGLLDIVNAEQRRLQQEQKFSKQLQLIIRELNLSKSMPENINILINQAIQGGVSKGKIIKILREETGMVFREQDLELAKNNELGWVLSLEAHKNIIVMLTAGLETSSGVAARLSINSQDQFNKQTLINILDDLETRSKRSNSDPKGKFGLLPQGINKDFVNKLLELRDLINKVSFPADREFIIKKIKELTDELTAKIVEAKTKDSSKTPTIRRSASTPTLEKFKKPMTFRGSSGEVNLSKVQANTEIDPIKPTTEKPAAVVEKRAAAAKRPAEADAVPLAAAPPEAAVAPPEAAAAAPEAAVAPPEAAAAAPEAAVAKAEEKEPAAAAEKRAAVAERPPEADVGKRAADAVPLAAAPPEAAVAKAEEEKPVAKPEEKEPAAAPAKAEEEKKPEAAAAKPEEDKPVAAAAKAGSPPASGLEPGFSPDLLSTEEIEKRINQVLDIAKLIQEAYTYKSSTGTSEQLFLPEEIIKDFSSTTEPGNKNIKRFNKKFKETIEWFEDKQGVNKPFSSENFIKREAYLNTILKVMELFEKHKEEIGNQTQQVTVDHFTIDSVKLLTLKENMNQLPLRINSITNDGDHKAYMEFKRQLALKKLIQANKENKQDPEENQKLYERKVTALTELYKSSAQNKILIIDSSTSTFNPEVAKKVFEFKDHISDKAGAPSDNKPQKIKVETTDSGCKISKEQGGDTIGHVTKQKTYVERGTDDKIDDTKYNFLISMLRLISNQNTNNRQKLNDFKADEAVMLLNLIHKEHTEHIQACAQGKTVKEKPILIELTLSKELKDQHPELKVCIDAHNNNVKALKAVNADGDIDVLKTKLNVIGNVKLQAIPSLEDAKALAKPADYGEPSSGRPPYSPPPTFIVKK